jgi:DNA-binding MarR family transcriptional regulator
MNLPRIVHQIRQETGVIFAEHMNGAMTLSQGVLLLALAEKPGVDQTTLVDATGIDRSTLSDVVRRLQKRGVLNRKRSKEDARCYAVNFTAEGNKVLDSVRAAMRQTDRDLRKRYPGLVQIGDSAKLAA